MFYVDMLDGGIRLQMYGGVIYRQKNIYHK